MLDAIDTRFKINFDFAEKTPLHRAVDSCLGFFQKKVVKMEPKTDDLFSDSSKNAASKKVLTEISDPTPPSDSLCSSAARIALFVPAIICKLGFCLFSSDLKEAAHLYNRAIHHQFHANIRNDEELYSPKRDASEKLFRQLYFAEAQRKEEGSKGFKYDENLLKNPAGYKIDSESLTSTQAALSETQGRRASMEDAHIATELSFSHKGKIIKAKFFGIFDGHCGKEASKYVSEHIKMKLEKELHKAEKLNDTNITNALTKTFVTLNKEMGQKELEQNKKTPLNLLIWLVNKITCNFFASKKLHGGTTATCSLMLNGQIYTPNVGDSRTILVRDTKTLQLSEDAKPDHPRFVRAAKKAGIKVASFWGVPRLVTNDGLAALAVARDLGLPLSKLSARPKITKVAAEGKFLVLACDGLYDVATTNEVGQFVREMDQKGHNALEISQALTKMALLRDSGDNISVMVVRL